MAAQRPESFFLVLYLNDGAMKGHAVTMTSEGLESLDRDTTPTEKLDPTPEADEPAETTPVSFKEVFDNFASVMTVRRQTI